MIAKLSGIIDSIAQTFLIIDVNGVGYQVFASPRTLSRIGNIGDPVSMLIDTHVREDHIHLLGFQNIAEQEWFRMLTSVQGVGVKAAMAILGACPVEKLGFAIAAQDKAVFTQAEGVGPKLATRIVTELKDKAGKMDLTSDKPSISDSSVTIDNNEIDEISNTSIDNDAISALVNLGYARTDAYTAVIQVRKKSNDNNDLEELIRLALKELSVR
jgi:Holliday junction DNA helicase RuvA